MRIDEALRIAQYARKPISMSPDKYGRPVVDYWLVATQRGYFGGEPSGFTICYSDMVPKSEARPGDVARYLYGGADDWQPYPNPQERYVIDFRRRYLRIPMEIDPKSTLWS